MYKILSFGLFFVLLSAGVLMAADNPVTAPNSQIGGQNQQSISGTLESISDTSLEVKTTDGETKNLTIKPEKKSQISSIGLKKGDRVTAQVDQQNQVVEVTRMGG